MPERNTHKLANIYEIEIRSKIDNKCAFLGLFFISRSISLFIVSALSTAYGDFHKK